MLTAVSPHRHISSHWGGPQLTPQAEDLVGRVHPGPTLVDGVADAVLPTIPPLDEYVRHGLLPTLGASGLEAPVRVGSLALSPPLGHGGGIRLLSLPTPCTLHPIPDDGAIVPVIYQYRHVTSL